jgi:hypothetical protein
MSVKNWITDVVLGAIRVDLSRAQISRTSDLDSERKKCYTSWYPVLRAPLPKRKIKKDRNEKRREKKTRENKNN